MQVSSQAMVIGVTNSPSNMKKAFTHLVLCLAILSQTVSSQTVSPTVTPTMTHQPSTLPTTTLQPTLTSMPTFPPTMTQVPSPMPSSLPTLKPTEFATFLSTTGGGAYQNMVQAAAFCAVIAVLGLGMGILNRHHDNVRKEKKRAKVNIHI